MSAYEAAKIVVGNTTIFNLTLAGSHGFLLHQAQFMVQLNHYRVAPTRQLCRQLALRSSLLITFLLWATVISGHEMTPAYPVVKPSHVADVVKVEMSLFNSREEIEYYQIELFDLNWMNIPFSTTYRIMKIGYKEKKSFNVYIRKKDMNEAVYLCTTSKVKKTNQSRTLVSSKICSRLDGEPA